MAIRDPYLNEDDVPRGWSDRPTVPELRSAAQATLDDYAIEGIEVDPVREILFTNQVAASFWGRTWCANLEHWDASKHKLARGRTYVRCGAVVNLRVFDGRAFARVAGTGLHTVVVPVEPIPVERWRSIRDRCSRRVESLVDLLRPEPPAPLQEIVAHPETGLFPAFAGMKVTCDCHYRTICVHAAAAMYGIGARLDRSPEDLLRLRGLDPDRLTEEAAAAAASPAGRELEPADLPAIFGVTVADEPPAG